MMKRLFRALVVTRLDQRLIGLSRACFGRDVCPQVADHVAPLLDICRSPATSLAVEEVRPTALDLENWCLRCRFLIDLAGMLSDQFADHFEVAKLLDRDVLQHIADRSIFDVEGLHPVLQSGS